MKLSESVAPRWWAKVDQTDDCWLWRGHIDEHGYGRIKITEDGVGSARFAHRVGYELLVGPIPDGLTLDHLCRNPPCVNPAHLEPVTLQENIRRTRQTHCAKGHLLSEENSYIAPSRGTRDCRICKRARSTAWMRSKRERTGWLGLIAEGWTPPPHIAALLMERAS